MTWDVEVTNEFADWYGSLDAADQARIEFVIELLVEHGPTLGRPYADTLKGSKYSNMKELRAQAGGAPLRAFFAFDTRRTAIILIGGDKTGRQRFYNDLLPLADELYRQYLLETGQDDA